MTRDVLMPRLSDSMEEGTILLWQKRVGDRVEVGEELLEIETDKANMAYEADVAGTLLEILAEVGEVVEIGRPIARIGPNGAGGAPAEASQAGPRQAPAAAADDRIKASPLARRIAREQGIDLGAVLGSGPGGRIVRADVEEAAEPQPDAPAEPPGAAADRRDDNSAGTAKGGVEVLSPSRSQKTVARRMAEAKGTIPHFYLRTEVEMSAAVAARSRLGASLDEGAVLPSFNDMVVKAAAIALREFPKANGSYADGRFELHERVNVGVAVAVGEELLVPVLPDADRKGLATIAAESRALSARVREGSITPPELAGGTFSVSNLGMFGVTSFEAVVNPPQAAILAVGAIVERPVVRTGAVTVGHTMALTLSCDHRILYGAEGAQFLGRIRALLEEPMALAL
jgi:pyruvate dehydrogenase E2 component (dihydrolipoamide acetyltransferase)